MKRTLCESSLDILNQHLFEADSTVSAFKKLKRGMVISVSTGHFADPYMVVQEGPLSGREEPWDKAVFIARGVSASETAWLHLKGGKVVIEIAGLGHGRWKKGIENAMPVSSLELTGKTETPAHSGFDY